MKPYMCGDEPAVHVPSDGCECNYKIKKVEDSNYAAVYVLTNNGDEVEVPIQIPKDQYVESVTENEVECEGGTLIPPYEGAECGDHYLDIQMSDGSHFYVGLPTTVLTAGNNVYINESTVGGQTVYEINAIGGSQGGDYVPGDNIQINGNTISATDTTYTAGDNVTISSNVISADNSTTKIVRGSAVSEDVVVTRQKGTGLELSSVVNGDETTYTIGSPWFTYNKEIQYTISANGYKSITWNWLAVNGYKCVGIVECTTGSPHAYFATIGGTANVIKSSVAGTFTATATALYLKS